MTTSFDPVKHEYLIDGKRATGVTTVISVLNKPQLYGWYARMGVEALWGHAVDRKVVANVEGEDMEVVTLHELEEGLEKAKGAGNKKKEEAGTHGTDAHTLVEYLITTFIESNEGKPRQPLYFADTFTEAKFAAIKPFYDWAVENVDHFLFAERQMFNKELFIAGTADFAYIGKDGKKYMADFKTSSGVWGIDYYLQCAAYRLLAEAEGDAPYDGCTIVRMGKKGDFEVLHRFDYETDKEAFLACLTLYRAQATYKKAND